MTRDKIFWLLRAIVMDTTVGGKEIKPETRFIEDLKADSMDCVCIVMGIEHEFGIDIPDHDADKLRTVQQTIDYIASKI